MSSRRQWNSSGKKKETEKDQRFVEKDTAVKGLNMVIDTPSEDVNGSSWDIGVSRSSNIGVSWQRTRGTFYPFHTDGEEEGEMIESVVTGTVVDTFLSDRAKSHMVSINVDRDFVEGIKNLVRTVPGFQEPDFRWPFECGVAKFTEKEFIGNKFPVVWDGRGFEEAELRDVERRVPISAEVIEPGCQIMVEYVITYYSGRKPSPNIVGFLPGCSLKLLSIGLVGEGGGGASAKVTAAMKKRRMGYVG